MWSIDRYWFILSDPLFYESLQRYQSGDSTYISAVKELVPVDWNMRRNEIWLHCNPSQSVSPAQGWKIHLSATLDSGLRALTSIVPILVREAVPFKFAADPTILRLLTSKQWPRGSAGKFVTIYPRSTDQFISLLKEMDAATRDISGPYILSDRRYANSNCLYYRYGSFLRRTSLAVNGERRPYILSPGGQKVPDTRNAWFALPEWMQDPFQEEKNESGEDGVLKDGRYCVESVLRFSNSGGVYLATDTQSNSKVVIKEARPHVKPDTTNLDAVTLLQKERRILTKIEIAAIAPRVIDFFKEWEHHFLVEEYVDGADLRHYAASHAFTRNTHPASADVSTSLALFRDVYAALADTLSVLHQHNIAFRDLSPSNVIVMPDGGVKLVDFEAACEQGVDPVSRMFTAGFAALDHFTDDFARFESDYFALGALMLLFLTPVHAMIGLDPDALRRFAASTADDYGLPVAIRTTLLGLLSANPDERPSMKEVKQNLMTSAQRPIRITEVATPNSRIYQNLIDDLVRSTLNVASYEREDRLFPSDPKVFVTNPLSIAYGACGVAYAVCRIAGEVPSRVCDWILRHDVTQDIYPPGLYVGMAGIAWVLLELGFVDRGEELLLDSRTHPLLFESPDLFYGVSGWGMANLKFFIELHKQCYLDHAVVAGEWLLKHRIDNEKGCRWDFSDKQWIGLAHGSSGESLFLVYLFLATGEKQFLNMAERALQFDLSYGEPLERGLTWPTHDGPGPSVVPYWRYGTAGVGTALLRLMRVTRNESLRHFLDAMFQDTARKYTIFPGRFFGLAGLGDFLLDCADFESEPAKYLEAAEKVAAGIHLFQVGNEKTGPAFPGFDLWKISYDYGTGGAGIGLFLQRLLTHGRPHFMLDELLEPTPAQATKTTDRDTVGRSVFV